MTDEGAEPTEPHPDHVETVDALSDRARSRRAHLLGDDERAALVAQLEARPEGEAIRVGRYQLLELVGTGGMGMVWGAWDPELERRVAIKLVRQTSRANRERMLREGQVLARLSHPNVVPIFDVGEVGESVYLVMEWVRGTTLRAFAKSAPGWRAVLAAYREAGQGLAAAHRVNVIHRDFKPDNAVRGDDERVRVLDFGLAFSDGDGDVPRAVGTRGYMPPEQAEGDRATAASDQYAFGVSLREALGDGVPGWIAPILARGTAADAAARYPSMVALLAALERDPARTRRRAALGVVVAALAAGGFAIGRSRSQAPAVVEPCSGGADELAPAWTAPRRAAIVAHLRGLPAVEHGVIDRLAGDLDGYASAWVGEHKRACLAHERKALTAEGYQQRLGCLALARAQLDAVGEVMIAVDAAGVDRALASARSMPAVAACAEPSGPIAPPPAAVADRVEAIEPRLERARVFARSERLEALDLARAAVADARATGYAPLIARARLVEALALTVRGDDANEIFKDAVLLALAGSDDLTAVEAYAGWTYTQAVANRRDLGGWPLMRAIADRLGRRGQLVRALLYRAGAMERRGAGDNDGALALLRTARDIRGDLQHSQLVVIDFDLAAMTPDLDEAARLLRASLAQLEAILGTTSPKTVITRLNLGELDRDRRVALQAAVDAYDQTLAAGRGAMAASFAYEAGWIADDGGDREAAAMWMRRVADSRAEDERTVAAAFVAAVTDAPDRAKAIAGLEQWVAALHPVASWGFYAAGDAYQVVALDADRHGRTAAATRAWEQAVAMYDRGGGSQHARRIARARAELAERWAAARPDDARRHAAAALRWYRGAPGEAARIARLETIAR